MRRWHFFERKRLGRAFTNLLRALAKVFTTAYRYAVSTAGSAGKQVLATAQYIYNALPKAVKGAPVATIDQIKQSMYSAVLRGRPMTALIRATYSLLVPFLKGRPYGMTASVTYTASAFVKSAVAKVFTAVRYVLTVPIIKGRPQGLATSARYGLYRAVSKSAGQPAPARANYTSAAVVRAKGTDPIPTTYVCTAEYSYEKQRVCPDPYPCVETEACEQYGGTCVQPCEHRDPSTYCCCQGV
jgi:hypothetical protein